LDCLGKVDWHWFGFQPDLFFASKVRQRIYVVTFHRPHQNGGLYPIRLSMGAAARMQMSEIPTVDQKQFHSDELLAITAVVLGGTNIFGGQGSIPGTVLALLLLVVVHSAMGVANVRVENQLAIVGMLLIASVLIGGMMNQINLKLSRRFRGNSHA
jgi:hypothetical protein